MPNTMGTTIKIRRCNTGTCYVFLWPACFGTKCGHLRPVRVGNPHLIVDSPQYCFAFVCPDSLFMWFGDSSTPLSLQIPPPGVGTKVRYHATFHATATAHIHSGLRSLRGRPTGRAEGKHLILTSSSYAHVYQHTDVRHIHAHTHTHARTHQHIYTLCPPPQRR